MKLMVNLLYTTASSTTIGSFNSKVGFRNLLSFILTELIARFYCNLLMAMPLRKYTSFYFLLYFSSCLTVGSVANSVIRSYNSKSFIKSLNYEERVKSYKRILATNSIFS